MTWLTCLLSFPPSSLRALPLAVKFVGTVGSSVQTMYHLHTHTTASSKSPQARSVMLFMSVSVFHAHKGQPAALPRAKVEVGEKNHLMSSHVFRISTRKSSCYLLLSCGLSG